VKPERVAQAMTANMFGDTGKPDILVNHFSHAANTQPFPLVVQKEMLIRAVRSDGKPGFQRVEGFFLKRYLALFAAFAVNSERFMQKIKVVKLYCDEFTHPNAGL